MADTFQSCGFSNLGVGNLCNVYSYVVGATLTTSSGVTHFNTSSQPGLKVGDIIIAQHLSSTGNTEIIIFGITKINTSNASICFCHKGGMA